jgi:hypothetical protein
MGEHNVEQSQDDAQQRAFMKFLLSDIHVRGALLELGLFDSVVRRSGAELKVILVESDVHLMPGGEALHYCSRQITMLSLEHFIPRMRQKIAEFHYLVFA